MKVTIKIDTDNDAFGSPTELPRILRLLADRFFERDPFKGEKIFDMYGNTVGSIKVSK